MSTRRQLLQIAAAGATLAQAQQHEGHDAAEPKTSKKTARYFKKPDLDLLSTLADHILRSREDRRGYWCGGWTNFGTGCQHAERGW